LIEIGSKSGSGRSKSLISQFSKVSGASSALNNILLSVLSAVESSRIEGAIKTVRKSEKETKKTKKTNLCDHLVDFSTNSAGFWALF
jgi:hypothetical protein